MKTSVIMPSNDKRPYNSLAQWKVERGSDIQVEGHFWVWGLIFTPFFFLIPLTAPFGLWYAHKGKKLEQEGVTEGGRDAARQHISAGVILAVPPSDWERRTDARVRRFNAPIHPPKFLPAASE